ncbi:uncharacterized protein [Panulirus ornatus]|uniref:uncharacterized protein n=1 Tax=Panulirus ornatus TaxID=150431 RepID=UPI003A8C1113
MDKVEELRQQVKEALEIFQSSQRKKQLYLMEIHKTVIEILMKNMNENFRLGIQDYFESRNERLHKTLKTIDEMLNQASEAHARISSFRSRLVDACNTVIQPAIKTESSHVLVNGQGVANLQKVSEETEQCVLQINELQDKYCNLMTDIEDKVPQRTDAILSATEAKTKNGDQERDREVTTILKAIDEELEKAVQVLESMEKMKKQMECLFQILGKPSSAQ